MERPEFDDLIYLQEIRTQCDSVLYALEQFNKRIREVHQPRRFEARETPNSEVFRALHSFLAHSANISRLLFPGKKSDTVVRQRGRRLRQALGVDAGSPLAKPELRNHLEHYDDRFDRWLRQARATTNAPIAADSIHPKGEGPDVPPEAILRRYLTDTREFCFMGEVYELVPLVREVRRILDEVNKLA